MMDVAKLILHNDRKGAVKWAKGIVLSFDGLRVEAPSPDQVWNEAAEWVRNNYQDHPNIADLCDAMLKRPSQAQEPSKPVAGIPASTSGAVDELPPLPMATHCPPYPGPDVADICDAYESGMGHGLKQDGLRDGAQYFTSAASAEAYTIGYDEGAERATQPAQQAPAVSEYNCPVCGSSDCQTYGHLKLSGSDARALLSQPAAAPVSEQAVPKGFVMVPTDMNSVVNMGWVYLDKAREESPLKEWAFSPAGFIAAVNSAPSNQSQGGDKP